MGLVAVVESESQAAECARLALEQSGHEMELFTSIDAVNEAQRRKPSLMLIADVLPDGNGLDLCRCLRAHPSLSKTPIILLLSNAREEDYVEGLESGADDCVSKPFTARELAARVQGVLRRASRPQPIPISEPTDIVIDKAAMKLCVRGREVPTTTLEFRLIDYLARHRGQVFTRDLLLDAVWGEMQFVTPRSVDACVRRVRNKIEPDRGRPTYLKTLRGIGYRFDAVAYWPDTVDTCNCPACAAALRSARTLPNAALRRRGSA